MWHSIGCFKGTHSAEGADRGSLALEGQLQTGGVKHMATGQKHRPGVLLLLVSRLQADAAFNSCLDRHVSDWQHHQPSSSGHAWQSIIAVTGVVPQYEPMCSSHIT